MAAFARQDLKKAEDVRKVQSPETDASGNVHLLFHCGRQIVQNHVLLIFTKLGKVAV